MLNILTTHDWNIDHGPKYIFLGNMNFKSVNVIVFEMRYWRLKIHKKAGKSHLSHFHLIFPLCVYFMLTWTVIYHWKRQLYFFLANLFLKQGISSEYVLVDFICMGILGLQGAKTEKYKNVKKRTARIKGAYRYTKCTQKGAQIRGRHLWR